jgi:DNA-binding CsgD family transcriptional regulator
LELTDAVLWTPAVNSFAEFSLCPAFRRRWPSLYEALQDSQPDRLRLLDVYVAQLREEPRPVFMGDHTAWPRPKAKTLRDRTVEHQPTPIPGAKPITVGQGYSTLAWLPETQGSWALPLLHERIPSPGDPLATMARQWAPVCARLPGRGLGLFDAEYGNAPFVQQTAGIACDKIVRLRSNLCLRTAPPPYRGWGRPAVHGRKFKFRDARTWDTHTETLQVDDPDLGPVTVYRWEALHFLKAHAQPMTVICIECHDPQRVRRDRRVVWLAWLGAHVHIARGESTLAQAALERAAQQAARYDMRGLRERVALHRAWLALTMGCMDEAGRWAEAYAAQRVPAPESVADFSDLLLARIWLRTGRAPEAQLLMDELRVAAERSGRGWTALQALALLALAAQAQGDHRCALSILAEVLSRAEPEGYVRLFIDEGQVMQTLLLEHAHSVSRHDGNSSGRMRAYVEHVLAAFGPAREAHGNPHMIEALSARERDVLKLMAGGASNQVIAATLVISVGTVKSHINCILGKLGAHNRTEAVVRAQTLDLL